MSISGTTKATNAGTYKATFTLKTGYAWTGLEITQRSVDADWVIKEPVVKPKQETTFDVNPDKLYVNQYGKLEVIGIKDNPTMYWTIDDDPNKFEWSSDEHTYVAYIHALTAGTAHATLHINESANYAATDVPVEFEILGQATEDIQLDASYSVGLDKTIDVEASGFSEGRLVTWSIVSGAENIELKYVNNNPVAVVGVAEGSAVIKITVAESIKFAESSATTTINVQGKPKQEVTLDKSSLTLEVSGQDTVTVSGMQENPSIE